jgi:hypothetical protein
MIAEERNRKGGFESSESFDAVAGCPAGVCPQGTERDYAANPTNPVEKPAPMKGGK